MTGRKKVIEMAKKYQVTLMSAVDELQRVYRALNEKYFSKELEDVIITIQSDTKRRAYAWITVGKVWSDKNKEYYREINIVAEWLNRSIEEVCCSLLHEMCHLYNLQRGIQDTSRGGTYHNKEFYDVCITHGLKCEKVEKYGYALTMPSEELIAWTKENVREGCFRYKRTAVWYDGTPKKTKEKEEGEAETGKPTYTNKPKTNIIKYVCPSCGMIVRASKNLDDKIKCVDCDKVLVRG